ncbi:hypothetical protein BH11PSE8_BH11PSE8_35810 [soil metagenome]
MPTRLSLRVLISALTFVSAAATAFAAQAAETLRYVLLASDGTPAGEQVVERADDGQVTVRYRFKDNGRGPELSERITPASDGTMDAYQVTGASTMGGPVDERYSRSGDKAEWRSTAERGAAKVSGTAMYVPRNGSFEPVSMNIAALAARADGQLPLLPSGTLTQRVIDEVELSNPSGERRRVQLLVHTGLGFTPSFYWGTGVHSNDHASGGRPRLFAMIYPGWMTAIEAGWEAGAAELRTHQAAAEGKLLKEMAARLMKPLSGLTVVRNARIFDSDKAQLGPASDVYVLRGRITAIRPAGSTAGPAEQPADQEIDAAGRVMLPGLFDMHGHVDRWDGGLNLAAGVTTVRDMGNDNHKMQQMIDERIAGELLTPQVIPCGFLEGESPNAARMGFVVQTQQQAREAVDWYAVRGYPQLKIYNSFPKALVRETVAYAHARGMRVSGHVPVFMRAQDVVDQGFDEIQHINQVLLNFLVTPTTDTRTLERFYLPAKKVAGLDFDSKPVRDFVALLARKRIAIDPTLVTFDFIKQREGTLSEPYAAVASHLPPDVQRSLLSGEFDIPDDTTEALYRRSYEKMVAFVGRLYRAGVPLVAGTDAVPGFTLQSELELYVKAGLTPAQALQVATRNGATYTRTSADRGSITVGKLADLVLVDGEPTQRIGDLRRVALVITQGKVVSPSKVYEALGIRPFVDSTPQVRALAQ